MTAPVFIAETADLASGDTVVVTGAEAHHALRVQRLRHGEQVVVTDGQGLMVMGIVDDCTDPALVVHVASRVFEPAPSPTITVAQAIPKGDRAERAVELLAEVGVDAVIPWSAHRSVVRWNPEQAKRGIDRWRRVAHAASKQARRSWLLRVEDGVETGQLQQRIRTCALAVVLDASGDTDISSLTPPSSGEVVLVVGPEGGLTDDERATLLAAGARPARLGPTIMRTSTAGAVAAALMLSGTPRWSTTP